MTAAQNISIIEETTLGTNFANTKKKKAKTKKKKRIRSVAETGQDKVSFYHLSIHRK